MSFENALVMFFSGVVAHAIAIRIFGVWSKRLLYRITFINCLAALKLADGLSQDLIKVMEPEQSDNTETIFKHWRKMALFSLKTTIPDQIWSDISVDDWNQAMKILNFLEKQGERHD